ncbi:MAG TPA: hypothetical protein VHS28_04970 [Chloroflexota bacterium]|nr:hypothetical protein [Chloroflexota bacterium]
MEDLQPAVYPIGGGLTSIDRPCRRIASLIVALLLIVSLVSWAPTPRVGELFAAESSSSPILVVIDSASTNPFGAYLGEILKSEGFNSFQLAGLSDLSTQYLAGYSTVILSEMALSSDQATMFSNYVAGGGTLIGMRPDWQLSAVFGLSSVSGNRSEGYLRANTSYPVGAGISAETMQIHGAADLYTLNGATQVAGLYADRDTATPYPAVVVNSYGSGRSAAFTFDLAKSVAYIRQGNPAWAGVDRDGDGVIRSVDIFNGWTDLDRIQIPQADEQQRLLGNLITYFGKQTMPIPRIWYFPSADNKSMLVVTSDDHGMLPSRFSNFTSIVERYGGRMTFYLAQWGALDSTSLQAMQARGNDFSVHPYGYEYDQTLDQGYAEALNWFRTKYGSEPGLTERNHMVEWQGWVDAAKVALTHGREMTTDYYHWGLGLQKQDGEWVPAGYVTGSGLPMRLVDEAGTIVSEYQQATQLVDEHMMAGAGVGYAGLTQYGAVDVSQQMIDRSISGYYSALTMQVHTDYAMSQWLDGVASYAQSRGVPIWTADRWLDFTKARHDAVVDQFSWDPGQAKLSFHFTSSTEEPTATVLIPLDYRSFPLLSVSVDGVQASTSYLSVKGFDYAAVPVGSGSHTVVASYNPVATITPSLTPTTTPTATVTPTPTPGSLVAALAMDEGAGTTVSDASGHNNTGTVFGTPGRAVGSMAAL